MTWEEFVDSIFSSLHLGKIYTPEQLLAMKAEIKSGSDLNDLLATLLIGPKIKTTPAGIATCQCGVDLESVLQTGKLGCSNCYTHFYEALCPYIVQLQQGGIKHVGKRPTHAGLTLLENELAQAIKEERYEKAAELRDKIKELRWL